MKRLLSDTSTTYIFQILLYLFVNALFILKYFARAGFSSPLVLIVYSLSIFAFSLFYKTYSPKIQERVFKITFWSILSLVILSIIVLLVKIDPYSVRVDRWSAVSFFLDSFFQGEYPYAAHTHVSTNNFASPFPIWHLINIPFYFMGDVGIGLIFFLLLSTLSIHSYFQSYKKTLFFLLLLVMSPAYWWEVAVRSDSLSNALLVFSFIIIFIKRKYSLSKNFWFTVVVCGLIASTRMSAILPVALFLFKPYTQLPWKRKIIFPAAIIGVCLLTFSPFIFWDTTNWIFFSRNPFMSQSAVGNPYLLSVMLVIGGLAALWWKNTKQFLFITATFIFLFIFVSQLFLFFKFGVDTASIFDDNLYDISYFSLFLPYSLSYLSSNSE
jgi:hypothetical protein